VVEVERVQAARYDRILYIILWVQRLLLAAIRPAQVKLLITPGPLSTAIAQLCLSTL